MYQVIVALFAAVNAICIGIAAAGLRSWSHAGLSVLGSVLWVLFLSAFFAPIRPSESEPRPNRSLSTARIAAGIVILFLSGWAIIGGIDEFARGVVADNILEAILFEMFLTGMGALLVWRGWQRRRGISWATFPGTTTSLRSETYGEKRSYLAGFFAFFILGATVLFSFNFYDGGIAFQPSGWLVIPIGLVAAATILMANRRIMRKTRTCLHCGQHVPLGATACPSCSRPFP